MARWPDGSMARWLDGPMVRWSDGPMFVNFTGYRTPACIRDSHHSVMPTSPQQILSNCEKPVIAKNKGWIDLPLLLHIQVRSVSFEQQYTLSIEFRGQLDSARRAEDADYSKLEAAFRKTSVQAMQEPFFSLRQQLSTLADDYVRQRDVQPFPYQSLADSHVFLHACLEQKAVKPNYMSLTIGDVSLDGLPLYDTTRATLYQSIDHGISTKDLPRFHVWLTLADMTVIDLTLGMLLSQNNMIGDELSAVENQRAIIWRPERPGRIDYHPILVDDQFLKRLQKLMH